MSDGTIAIGWTQDRGTNYYVSLLDTKGNVAAPTLTYSGGFGAITALANDRLAVVTTGAGNASGTKVEAAVLQHNPAVFSEETLSAITAQASTVVHGSNFNFSFNVQNVGTGPAPAGTAGIFVDQQTTQLTSISIGALAPGASMPINSAISTTNLIAGAHTLWVETNPGGSIAQGNSWSSVNFTVSPNISVPPTLAVTNVASATRGQVLPLSSVVTISDPSNFGYQKLELWDSNGTVAGGQFKINGVAQTGGHEIDVTSATFASTVFDAPTAGGTDTLWAQLQLNDGTLSGWKQFSVTVPMPTLSVSSVANATAGQVINLSTLVHVADPSSVGYQKLELWDSTGTAAGGQFKINGAAQTGGHEIDVTSVNVAGTVFDAPTAGGSDTLWAQLQLNDGTLSGWKQFSVTVPVPTLSVSSVANATAGQVINLSTLVHIADSGNVGYQKLELWDSNGTATGGQFKINGIAQSGGHEIDVTSVNVAGTVFDAPTAGGTDTLWAQLQLNDGTLSGWKQFSVTVPPPTLSVSGVASATAGQVINLSTLVNVADPSNVGYQKLELWDSNGTVAGGQFKINGIAQTGGHEIDVTSATFASTVFDAPSAGGTDTLWAQLVENDGTLSGWKQFSVTVPMPTLSVSTVANATAGQVINLSTLVNVADPSNVGYQKLELWDSNGTAAGGQFKINGISQTGGHEIDVTSATFAGTVFDAPTAGGTDTLWAQLQLNDGTLSGWKQFSVTVPPPTLVAHNYSTATPGQVIALSNLLTITDSSNVGYQKLELWDSNGTVATGQFVVNGAPQSGGHEIDVIPANVANTVFDEGTTGNTDTLWARLQQNDGTLTAWQQFTVVDPLDIAAGATLDLSSPYAGTVNFLGATGTLQLDHSSLFTGTVAGLIGADTIDLRDIGFTAQPLFSATSTGGILGVTDGTNAASIQLLGDYAASSFVASSDGHGGTSIAIVIGRLSA